MDDTLTCPICGNKLRSCKSKNKYLPDSNASYKERTCPGGANHSVQFYTNEETGNVDLLKVSLNPKYSRYLEIDFHNQKCRIICLVANKPEYINIEKMIEPDFPDLVKLKEKVSLYITFS